MIRVLFSALAVVAAVLAIVLEQPLLYAAAAVMLLIVAILWIAAARRRHRAAQKPFKPVTTAPPAPDENLKALGIMDIRPKAAARFSEPTEATPVEEPSAETTPVEETHKPTETTPVEETHEPTVTTPVEETHEPTGTPASTLKEFVIQPADPTARVEAPSNGIGPAAAFAPHDVAVFGPFLQALRAALGAHTVCVLKQEEMAFEYQVIALVGDGGAVQSGDTFSVKTPLLTAHMAHQSVTVRRVDADDLPRSSLGYRRARSTVRQVAIAPAPHHDAEPDAYFLLADTPRTDLLNQTQAHTLLSQFARLLGVLLDASAPAPAAPARTAEPTAETAMRPRREIIAEEMALARDRNLELALALVYLNRAEDLAAEGEETVAEAEQHLKTRLTLATHDGRVVRFGELTYGVFYDGDLPEVEAWGARIQAALAQETGLLEGGVSIGIALLQDRHQTPDAFRDDATEALREAFETGTCTILE